MYCCNNNEYRKLCSYDNTHNTCNPILGQSSFVCNNQQCVHTNKSPGPGRFTTISDCQKNCGSPVGTKSFKCVGMGYGGGKKQCVVTNKPPGPFNYTTMSDCKQKCGKNVGDFSYICKHMSCEKQNIPPGSGTFPSMKECQKSCTGNVTGIY